VKIGTADKYVMFVGGGFDSAINNAHGKALFAVDLSNGSRLWQYYNDATADDRQYMNFSLPEKATAVDLDNNGYVDHIYVGDVGGQLWKFDVSATATTSWTGKRLFVASPTQANPRPPASSIRRRPSSARRHSPWPPTGRSGCSSARATATIPTARRRTGSTGSKTSPRWPTAPS